MATLSELITARDDTPPPPPPQQGTPHHPGNPTFQSLSGVKLELYAREEHG